MFISQKTILESSDDKKTGAIALALMIKSVFANSVIYNYSPHRHSQIFDISTQLMQKSVSWLIKKDYAEIANGHLRIKKLSNKKKGYNIPIRKKDIRAKSYAEVKDFVRVSILRKKWGQQIYRAIEKSARNNKLNVAPSSIRAQARAQNEYEAGRETKANFNVSWSIETIADLIGCSRATVFPFLKRQENKNLLKRKNNHRLLFTHLPYSEFLSLIKYYEGRMYRTRDGSVYSPKPNTYWVGTP